MTFDWWTLGLQTINVIVLIWLLQRFFWRPVAGIIAARRALADKTLADAKTESAKATAELADIAKTRAGFDAERAAILTTARADAATLRTAQLAEAATQVAALETAAKARIAAEREADAKAWGQRSSVLGVDIARRLAARLDGPQVRQVFLDWLVAAIGALPEATRQAARAKTTPFDAASATPLDAAEQAHASEAIGAAFGGPVAVNYATDPTLIAGLELRGDHLIVGNSWQADLIKIQAELQHDRHD